MADNYLLYDVTITPQTPLHIGSGRDLLHEYDYAIAQGQTWRIDELALLDAQAADDARDAERLARSKPVELLNKSADFHPNSPYFRYVLKGTPRSNASGAQLKEQIKDPFDRPYLPGSSLKGALRTALAWIAWGESSHRVDLRDLGQRKQWAAQPLEHNFFGRDPNHDALRALHIADSAPLTAASLMIVNVRVHHRNGNLASPIELEAIRPNTTFTTTLKLDLALYSDWARRAGLNLPGRDWLLNLPTLVQQHSAERIRRELAWFKAMPKTANAGRVAQAYTAWADYQPGPQQCLIQLGWGAGWDNKTFGSRLQADPQLMERLIGEFKLARGKRQRGDPFPKSRRLAVSVARDQQGNLSETPAVPLGWCLLEVKERRLV